MTKSLKKIPNPADLEPTFEEVNSVRRDVKIFLRNEGLHDFDSRGVQRILDDDYYVRRFIAENSHDKTKATKNILETLRWRKENYVFDVYRVDQDPRFGLIPIFAHNRDLNGCKMLMIKVKEYNSGLGFELVKKVFLYWMERMEREEYGSQCTIIFDMNGIRKDNIDMKFLNYMITVLSNYYPWSLSKFIVLDVHKIFHWVWVLLMPLLPEKALGLVHFIKKEEICKFVSLDQCPAAWKGTDVTGFSFQPEVDPSRMPWNEAKTRVKHLYSARRRLG